MAVRGSSWGTSITMDLYGHLINQNLWHAARRGAEHTGPLGVSDPTADPMTKLRARALTWGWVESPVGIEPTTFS